MPQVSVVTPVLNAAPFMQDFIACMQAQTLQDWELLVIDDASQDRTVAMVTAYMANEPRIQLIRMPENGGPSIARNVGIAAARGDWIALVDADDLILPERLETMVAHADAHGLDMVADNQTLYDLDAGRVARVALADQGVAAIPLTAFILFENDGPPCSFSLGLLKPLVRRQFLLDHDVRFQCRFRSNEDFMFHAEALVMGARAEILMKPMYRYTQQRGSISRRRSQHSRSGLSWQRMITMSDGFSHKHRARIDPQLRAAVERRRQRLERAVTIADLQSQLQQHLFGGFAMGIAANPRLWPLLARKAVGGLESPHRLLAASR